MARGTGATCRISRRYGVDLEFKTRDIESKCKFASAPGQHGKRRKQESGYASQLAAKQMLRHKYGVLERQFRKMYKEATRRAGATGVTLLQLLEGRLDNVVYRMGFARTRREARQLVSHKSILVNGACINIPSCQIEPGSIISIKEKSKLQERISDALKIAEHKGLVDWVVVDPKKFSGEFKRLPERQDLPLDINEQLIVELYSK